MNNKEFIAELAGRTGYKATLVQKMVSTVLTTMAEGFMEGDSVHVSGFGNFEVRKKMERIIVNPSSGQRMLVPPKLVLGFRPNAEWKEKVKSGDTE